MQQYEKNISLNSYAYSYRHISDNDFRAFYLQDLLLCFLVGRKKSTKYLVSKLVKK